MQDRLLQLLDEAEQLAVAMSKISSQKRARLELKLRLEKIKDTINKFGQKHPIVMVTMTYMEKKYGALPKKTNIFYTGITIQDAIDYTKSVYKSSYVINELIAKNMPLGRLIELNLQGE